MATVLYSETSQYYFFFSVPFFRLAINIKNKIEIVMIIYVYHIVLYS